jgi:hypothetical protein
LVHRRVARIPGAPHDGTISIAADDVRRITHDLANSDQAQLFTNNQSCCYHQEHNLDGKIANLAASFGTISAQ